MKLILRFSVFNLENSFEKITNRVSEKLFRNYYYLNANLQLQCISIYFRKDLHYTSLLKGLLNLMAI